jgi:hypothetical protein
MILPKPYRWGGIVAALFSFLHSVHVVRADQVDPDPTRLDSCPGYNATNVNIDGPTLTARLVLAGAPCNVFGNDIGALNLSVTYETGA